MKLAKITFATLFLALPAEAIAGDCTIVYDNNVEVQVKDESTALAGGFAFGLIGSLVASTNIKANNNDFEIEMKRNIDTIDNYQYINKIHEVRNISEKLQGAKCIIELKLTHHEVAYSAASAILMMKFNIRKIENGFQNIEKDITLKRTAISPIPKTPKPKYKQESYGKWVNIAPPTPTQEEAIAAFVASYKTELNLLYTDLIKKKLKIIN